LMQDLTEKVLKNI